MLDSDALSGPGRLLVGGGCLGLAEPGPSLDAEAQPSATKKLFTNFGTTFAWLSASG
jgi:hypothetical protein